MNFSEHLLRKREEKLNPSKQLYFPLTMFPDAASVCSKCILSTTLDILFIMAKNVPFTCIFKVYREEKIYIHIQCFKYRNSIYY